MLLSYFTTKMPHLLAPFGDDSRISQFLLRIALMDETPASSAVLQGILALSSLKLYGGAEASLFKSKAISMLAASVKEGMHLSEHLRCLAASLLLGWYKISSNADPADGWAFFVCGAIKLAKAMSLPRILGSEEILLLDWLSCHTILAQFSTSHWRQSESCVYRQPCAEDPQLRNIYSLIPDRSRIMSFLGCSLEFLDILSLTCSAVLPRSHPNFLSREHKQQLDSLELRLISIPRHNDFATTTPREQKRTDLVAELYRLAGLVYLHRAGRRSRVGFQPTESVLRNAFSIIKQLEYCESVWPLFIIGCEARSDEQRLLIHQNFSKALKRRDTDNIRSIRKMVEASWIQDDLCEDEETDYQLKINALMSANTVLPIFM
ncbi:hypothetical protein B7494_g3898 [Chlorociboria aeruginascens]|nr:hypothetical protein B7494_g3898 [Chlorociboria aeruginascens]